MPTFHDVMMAYKATRPYVHETPVIASNSIQQFSGHEVALKCENLQRTGSYNLRGGMNFVIRTKLLDLSINHFVAQSTGNLGLAVALAASSFSATGHIVIPKRANDVVVHSIAHYSGKVYRCGDARDEQMKLTQKLVSDNNNTSKKNGVNACVFVHPQDDWLIAGYGTLGVELMLQTDGRLDAVVVPASEGALLAGVALAVKGMKPNVAVFAAECDARDPNSDFEDGPVVAVNKGEGGGDQDHSTQHANNAVDVARQLRTPLNATAAKCVNKYVDGVIKVTERQKRDAFRFVYERCKLVVDDSAATAVAAVLTRPASLSQYDHIGIVLAGGNVDLDDIPRLARL
ncbi:putative serine-threonine dehydratase [Trypanosoma conorhini]|uniref:Putative serine-threonine dehydratase n=1 Tax=Trypanosoma conorhini TaxID=83891 RepID=A0A3R7NX17_9TRYP|nr:putative serine-threonine dehydratase [Trypanosoma conorhini]RNF25121.1 putative serine-threonine dehydratase [Trypanosoma conorhini]